MSKHAGVAATVSILVLAGVPASTLAADCNGNGVEDHDDIASGTSADCNGNGVPDECDVASLTSGDIDGDLVPDECMLFNVPGQVSTIQAAIDMVVADGAIVRVAPGTYAEVIDLRGKAITLQAASGDPADTVIDGAGLNDSVVTCASSEGPATVVEGFTITGGAGKEVVPGTRLGGGMYVADASPTVRDCLFIDNDLAGPESRGGGLFSENGSPTIVGCVFEDNSAPASGGGVEATSATVANCVFDANAARDAAGALLGAGLVVNCVFRNNTAAVTGGGLSPGSATVAHCTFEGNGAISGASLHGGSGRVVNSILWDAPAIGSFTGTVAHCDVLGGHPGVGNIASDPEFVDAVGGDLRLQATSPCIDAGHTWLVPADAFDLNGNGETSELLPLDLDFALRCLDGPGVPGTEVGCGPMMDVGSPMFADMGAYEHPGTSSRPAVKIYNFVYTDDQRGRTSHLTGQGPLTDAVIARVSGAKIPLVYGHHIDYDADGTPLEDAAGTAGSATGSDARFESRLDASVLPEHEVGCLDWEVPFVTLNDVGIDGGTLNDIIVNYNLIATQAKTLKPGVLWGHFGVPRYDPANTPGYLTTYATQWASLTVASDVLYPTPYDILPFKTVQDHANVVAASLQLAADYSPGTKVIPIFNARVTGGHPDHENWISFSRAVEVAIALSEIRVDGTRIAGWGMWDNYNWSTQDTLDENNQVADQAEYDARIAFMDWRHSEIFRRVWRALSPGVKSGDTNADGAVDVVDLLGVLEEWGSCATPCCPDDLDVDGVVDVGDLLLILSNWS